MVLAEFTVEFEVICYTYVLSDQYDFRTLLIKVSLKLLKTQAKAGWCMISLVSLTARTKSGRSAGWLRHFWDFLNYSFFVEVHAWTSLKAFQKILRIDSRRSVRIPTLYVDCTPAKLLKCAHMVLDTVFHSQATVLYWSINSRISTSGETVPEKPCRHIPGDRPWSSCGDGKKWCWTTG